MRKCIIKLEGNKVVAAVDPKEAKKKEQFKKKLANLKDNYKAAKARVADLEKQIKALHKEYGVKNTVIKPKPKVRSALDRKGYNGKGTPKKVAKKVVKPVAKKK